MKSGEGKAVRMVAGGVALLLVGCSFSVGDRKGSLRYEKDVAANVLQMRLRMRSLVDPMSGQIERAADRIIAGTEDPGVRRAALEWKSQALPALREALYQPSPRTSILDVWVLLNQMTIFFDQGDGRRSLGGSAAIARDTCLDMEREFNGVVATMTKSGDVSELRDATRKWAAANPIKGSIAHRESVLSRAVDMPMSEDFTAGEAISGLNLSVDDLNRKLEIYTDQLPRQARWEAEMLAMDLAEDYRLEQAMPIAEMAASNVGMVAGSVDGVGEEIGSLVPLVERLTAVAESMPQVIAAERAVAIGNMQDEITRTIEFVQKERMAALQHVTAERLAALQTLHETIFSEREVLTADVEMISVRVVDHAFQRMSLLIGGVLVAVALAGLVGLAMVRRMVSGLMAEHRGAG